MQDRTKQGLLNELENMGANQELMDYASTIHEYAIEGPKGYDIFDAVKANRPDVAILTDMMRLVPISIDLRNRRVLIESLETKLSRLNSEYNEIKAGA